MTVPFTSRARTRRARFCTSQAALSGASLLAITTVLVAAPSAHAQSWVFGEGGVISPAPPTHLSVDDRGVDLASGTFYADAPTLSIGPEGEGGLTQKFFGSGNRDNFTGTITSQNGELSVSLGADTTKFEPNTDGTFFTAEGNGTSLERDSATGVYTYTLHDGSRAIFAPSNDEETPVASDVAYLVSLVRPNGLTLTYHYKVWTPAGATRPARRLQSVTNNQSYQIKYDYQDSGPGRFKVSAVRAINNAIDYCNPTADLCDDLTITWPSLTFLGDSVTDAKGGTTVTTHPDANTDVITFPGGRQITLTRVEGRLASYSDGVGLWRYAYTPYAQSFNTTVTDSFNKTRLYVGPQGTDQVEFFTDELGRTTKYEYDPAGRLYRITTPEGVNTQYDHDSRGNIGQVTVTPKPGSAEPTITTYTSYRSDADCANAVTCNLPNSSTDARGKVTTYAYDPVHGGLRSVTRPADAQGVVAVTHIDYAAQTAQVKDASGAMQAQTPTIKVNTQYGCTGADACAPSEARQVHIEYAGPNKLPSATITSWRDGTDSAVRTFGYDSIGNLISVTGPATLQVRSFRYDQLRQLIGAIEPKPNAFGSELPRATRITRDAEGRVTREEQGLVASASDTDWADFSPRLERRTAYDAIGRKVSELLADPGQAPVSFIQYGYDAESRLRCVTQRMNPATFQSAQPDACDLGAEGSFGPDRVTRYDYDPASQLVAVNEAVGTAQTRLARGRHYTPDGVVDSETDAKGNVTRYAPDGLNRIRRISYPDPVNVGQSTGPYRLMDYDAAGAVTGERLRDGVSTARVYDDRGRLTFATVDDSHFTYDSFDRVGRAMASGSSFTNTYNSRGQLLSQTGPRGVVSLQYDEAGRRTRLTWPDGFYVTYEYDAADRLVSIRENGGTALAVFGYTDLDQRASVARPNGTGMGALYGPGGRLSTLAQNAPGAGAQVFVYGLNPAGQVVSRSSSNGSYDAVAASGPTGYVRNGLNQYTAADGAAVSHNDRGDTTHDGVSAFGYDELDRLTSAGGAALTYDAFGRLLSAGGTSFLYDGNDLIAEYDASGALTHRYVHGPGDDEPLVAYDGPGTGSPRWLQADERGTIVATSDAAGAVTSTAIDDYGRGAPVSRFGFTGQAWLGEAGVYHYKARAYSPRLGRFLQPDPIGYADDMNAYRYVGNDPVNGRDPSGLSGCGSVGDTVYTEKGFTYTVKGAELECGSSGGSRGGALSLSSPAGSGFVNLGTTPSIPPLPAGQLPPKPPNTQHIYDDTYKVCKQGGKCTTNSVYKCLTKNPAPGISGAPVQDGSTHNVLFLGPVTTTVSPGSRTIVNSTLPEHKLYPGYVIRSVVSDSSGNIGVENTGYGTGQMGGLNSFLAPWVWSYQTTAIMACVASGGGQ